MRVAAEAVGMSYANVHKLRGYPGAKSFVKAWDAAIAMATARVQEQLIDHSVNGVPEPIVVGGKVVGARPHDERRNPRPGRPPGRRSGVTFV